jgi:ATP-dependent helicase Lhr and Lhr-like helicase
LDAEESISPIARWFAAKFRAPTPVQAAAWPMIRAGGHTLILAPTGAGKTFAAFHEVLDRLGREHANGVLGPGIHALYLSPLRALGYDLEKNLRGPLKAAYGGDSPIRVGIRSGDTTQDERRRQWSAPPHILLTTPESLTLMISQPRWVENLSRVRWVIIDETHALAENKRGALLTLAVERLEDIVVHGEPGSRLLRPDPPLRPPPQRIGLSATVYPADEAAAFLAGPGRPCVIVDVQGSKTVDIRLYSPLRRDPYPMAGFSGERLIGELGRLVRTGRTTLVFTNTRSGAESACYWLREAMPDLSPYIECHHASLDRDVRLAVEDKLKRGDLRCVVCSTSLELGVDIGSIDLVVMLATPKGVAKALQRTGRAGHNLAETSRGLLMATNVNDVVECAATALLARRRRLEPLRIPPPPLDVLAQHLMSMACHGEVNVEDAYALVRRSRTHRDLTREDFNDTLDYLAGGGESLRRQYADVFGKIVLDADRGVFEARAGAVRRDFLQNIGAISNDEVVRIFHRSRPLGSVEEHFIRQLRPGDVFSLSGRPIRLLRFGVMEAWVEPADGATPTTPRWGANKMPLSNRVGGEIASFRAELRSRFEAIPANQRPGLIPWVARRLEIDRANAAVVYRVHAAQHHLSELPTADFLLIECYREPATKPPAPGGSKSANRGRGRQPDLPGMPPRELPAPPGAHVSHVRHYFFHSLIGRAANDALSRVVALRFSRAAGGNAMATPDDYGFTLSVDDERVLTSAHLPALLTADGFEAELAGSLAQSDLLKYHFRNAAQTGLMVYRNYFGEQKSSRKVQWSAEVIFNVLARHEPNHVLMREARRDALHTFLDVDGAVRYLRGLADRNLPVRLREVANVPPLAFGMYATKIKEALLVEDPRETLERLYHEWWTRLGPEAVGEA